MKYVFPIIKTIVGAAGLRYSYEWQHNYTGADDVIIIGLSVILVISGLSEINQLINK